MKKRNLATRIGARVALLAAGLLVVLAGCGFPIHPGPIGPSTGEHACFDGSEVQLVRVSSACDRASKVLDSIVEDGPVFMAEDVVELELPCTDEPHPAIDLIFEMEHHRMVLDFSRVDQPGRFPEAEFDGYLLEVLLQESNGTLAHVEIDRDNSTPGFEDGDVVGWDHSHIDLNLAGLAYDAESRLTLNLIFYAMSPPGL